MIIQQTLLGACSEPNPGLGKRFTEMNDMWSLFLGYSSPTTEAGLETFEDTKFIHGLRGKHAYAVWQLHRATQRADP